MNKIPENLKNIFKKNENINAVDQINLNVSSKNSKSVCETDGEVQIKVSGDGSIEILVRGRNILCNSGE